MEPAFPGPRSSYLGRRLPEEATPVGYGALIGGYDLKVPVPRRLLAIRERHNAVEVDGWHLLTPRHAPAATLEGHLTIALKYEGVDLAVLWGLAQALGPAPFEALVAATPSGAYARRIWFFYEWLTGEALDLPDAEQGNYVDALDGEVQIAGEPTLSRRHRVRDNLPGTPEFCPLVFRTPRLEGYMERDLPARAQEVVGAVPADLLARTAAFLLLDDSRASFAIEGERPGEDRIHRWGEAIGAAGREELSLEQLEALQEELIGDQRFVHVGLRQDAGFVGGRDRRSGAPIPSHISAQAADLPSLIGGLVRFEERSRGIDAVVAATTLAFGFVYIHPFEDGNGRIHRYLFHHVLARRGFHPTGVVFPISGAILEAIEEYREVLESYSRRLLSVLDWKGRPDGNVEVAGESGAFYRYFDATPHAEFLYGCVARTVEEILPRETRFLQRYDRFCARVQAGVADMPEPTLALLYRFLEQNQGGLSRRAREREFAALSDEEAAVVEEIFGEEFAEDNERGRR